MAEETMGQGEILPRTIIGFDLTTNEGVEYGISATLVPGELPDVCITDNEGVSVVLPLLILRQLMATVELQQQMQQLPHVPMSQFGSPSGRIAQR